MSCFIGTARIADWVPAKQELLVETQDPPIASIKIGTPDPRDHIRTSADTFVLAVTTRFKEPRNRYDLLVVVADERDSSMNHELATLTK